MATYYWRGTTGSSYTSPSNWSTSITGSPTNGATILQTDSYVFQADTNTSTSLNIPFYSPGVPGAVAWVVNQYSPATGFTVNSNSGQGLRLRATSGDGIDMSNAGGDFTIAAELPIILQGSHAWNVGSNKKLIVNSVISGAFALTKSNAGTLRLSNANTFSGGLTISAGTVEIGNNSALGTGTVTMTGGKLSSSSVSDWFVGNAFSVSGTVSFLDATNTGYIATSGNFNIAAPTTMTLNAAQQLYVSGALNSTNSSATVSLLGVFGCTYRFVGAQGTFNSQITIGTNAGVQLAEYTSGTPNQFNGASTVALNTGSRLTYYGNTGTTVPYSISGAGTMTVVNPQTTTFSNTVSQSGPFEIYAGNGFLVNQAQKVVLSNSASVGTAQYYSLYSDAGATYTNLTQTIEYTGAGTATNSKIIYIDHVSNNGGTFIYRNNSSNNSTLNHTGQIRHNRPTLAELFDINAVNGPMTFSSTSDAIFEASTGVLSVKKTGTYAASINNTCNYRGTVSITEGTLNANSTTALGSATSTQPITVAAGTALILNASGINYPSRSLRLSGFNVTNTSCLDISNTGTSTFSNITLMDNSFIRATANCTLSAPVVLNGYNFYVRSVAGYKGVLSNTSLISGLGTVQIGFGSLDTGSVELSAPSVYSGNTTVGTGTLVFGASSNGDVGAITSGPIGIGNLVFGGGAVAASSEVTIKNPIHFMYSSSNLAFNGSSNLSLAASFSFGSTRDVNCSGNSILTLDGVLSGGSLVKKGSGTLKLTNTNAYTGTTEIQAGTLQICNSNNLGTNTIVLSGGCLSSNSTNGITLSNNLTVSSLSTLGDTKNKGPITFTSNISITSGGGITTPSGVENNLPNLILSGQAKFLFADTNNLPTGNLTIGDLTSTSNLIGSGTHWINLYYSNNSTPTSEYKSLIKHSIPSLIPQDFCLSGDYLAANQMAILASDDSSVGVLLKTV